MRDTEYFSIYSLMSKRIMASSEPKRALASVLASSVLPTPVGPKNRKEPIGRLGSFSPERARRMALAIALTASAWPITRSPSVFSSFSRRADSLAAI